MSRDSSIHTRLWKHIRRHIKHALHAPLRWFKRGVRAYARRALYTRLQDPKRQIRLLKLLPASDDQVIACELTTCWLDKVEDTYSAISYTWGAPSGSKPNKEIRVNGRILEVRSSCGYVLSQLQHHGQHTGSHGRHFWIDSICIDQQSHSEKGQQVQQMHQIYSKAHEVLACLGEGGRDRLLFHFHKYANWKTVMAAKKSFARRPFFSRLWIVQECILAKKLEILIGPDRAAWDDIMSLFRNTYTYVDPLLPDLAILDRDRSEHLRTSTVSRDLADLVIHYRDRSCYDLRDKIYAYLALVPPKIRARLEPDYGKPLLRVLLSFCEVHDSLTDAPEVVLQDVPSTRTLGRLSTTADALVHLVGAFSFDAAFAKAASRFGNHREGLWRLFGKPARNDMRISITINALDSPTAFYRYVTRDDFILGDSGCFDNPQPSDGKTKLPSYVSPGDLILRFDAGLGIELEFQCRAIAPFDGQFVLLGCKNHGWTRTSLKPVPGKCEMRISPRVLLGSLLVYTQHIDELDCKDLGLNEMYVPGLPPATHDDSVKIRALLRRRMAARLSNNVRKPMVHRGVLIPVAG